MPYCHPDQKREIDAGRDPVTEGELTYALQQVINKFLVNRVEALGCIRYADLDQASGALTCLQADFSDRIIMPYEAMKCAENGDVWDERLIATNR